MLGCSFRGSAQDFVGHGAYDGFSISLELNPKADDVDDILQLPEKIAQKKVSM